MNPAESGKLAARHYLVEIAEACRREADIGTMERNPSVQPVERADARLLARPILQEYDAFTSVRVVFGKRSAMAARTRFCNSLLL